MNSKNSLLIALAVIAAAIFAFAVWLRPQPTHATAPQSSPSLVAASDSVPPAPVLAVAPALVAVVERTGVALLALLAAAGIAFVAVNYRTRRGKLVSAINSLPANIGSTSRSRRALSSGALATRYLFVKAGADDEHIASIAATSDQPIGVVTDEAAGAEEPVNVEMPGNGRSLPCVAAAAIGQGVDVYTDATGKVQAEPAVAGTYWKVGTSRTAAGAANDPIEVVTCNPERVVMIASLTAPTTANAVDLATTEALANALKADVTSLKTALATPARIKIL